MSKNLVIIPTYNEIENIELMIHEVFSLSVDFDILIVDDNSPDGTATKVKELQNTYNNRLHLIVRKDERGLGTAYIKGFRWALSKDYEYICEMDADFSHNPKDLVRLYEECHENNADVAIGSRYVKGVNVVNWPLKRMLLSYGASMYVQLITGMNISDPTAGFVCYKRKVIETIDLDTITFVGYAFQIQMKYKAYLKKFDIREVSIIFTDRIRGKSKMSGKIIKEGIFGVLKMRWNQLVS